MSPNESTVNVGIKKREIDNNKGLMLIFKRILVFVLFLLTFNFNSRILKLFVS